jgi:hypothetical protein
LTDEYYKRFGIYTSEEGKLGDFWKNHVSSDYKRKREEAAMRRKTQSQFAMPGEMGFNEFPGFDD